MDFTHFAIIFACLALGGVLKGATGAGAPILAIPAIAMTVDVKFAVLVMLMPNLLTNIWQSWRYRHHRLKSRFGWVFTAAGCAGVILGTVILTSFSSETLSLVVAGAVAVYIASRIARPGWRLGTTLAERLSGPAGFLAGMLQGASGISAPVSLSFLNAVRLPKETFIFTISVFFVSTTIFQLPALGAFGLLTWRIVAISLAALLPIMLFMPVGAALTRRFSPAAFDRAILALLALIAIRLAWTGLAGQDLP